ncbi:phosphate ABC transporter, permease protein PstA [Paenibacillus sp. MY03]|jgi:phosphate transport system permease protein|uniref:Phosphate transport system permease protein PstA n=1 Tax=Paenibacillus agaridevorans TaxID=171404 RepID=A0A2R5EM46_9BACL|nr:MULTISPECIES: phosphate ABC transporter permease PstA [Paenibacillus]OUS76585.1 phosphate ABC transporter, permease protein PstA [Paenibacillus sp. MY03]GBG07746.1 phosphate ABC transporter, permease protein PstA [Paenibacillus agaridevorans]
MNNVVRNQKIAFACLSGLGLLTVLVLIFIIGYILSQGVSMINYEFLTSNPRKMGSEGGIFPAIVGTLYLVGTTMIIATPIGVGAAIYLNEYTARGKLTSMIRFATEALAGIPSIVFGLFGFAFFVILLEPITGGWSILSASLTGVTMVLPTIVRTSEEALKAVPDTLREGSLALGTTKWQTIKSLILPTAMPGIITGLILSIGRVVGETAAFLLTLGGTLLIPNSLLDGSRTLSLHLYMVAMETGAMDMAFGTAAVLIVLILIINLTATWLFRRLIKRFS